MFWLNLPREILLRLRARFVRDEWRAFSPLFFLSIYRFCLKRPNTFDSSERLLLNGRWCWLSGAVHLPRTFPLLSFAPRRSERADGERRSVHCPSLSLSRGLFAHAFALHCQRDAAKKANLARAAGRAAVGNRWTGLLYNALYNILCRVARKYSFRFPEELCVHLCERRRGSVRGCGSVCASSVRKFLSVSGERAFRIVCSSLGQQRFRVERAGFIACGARSDGPRLAFLCFEGCVCVWSSSRYCSLFDLKGKKNEENFARLLSLWWCDCAADFQMRLQSATLGISRWTRAERSSSVGVCACERPAPAFASGWLIAVNELIPLVKRTELDAKKTQFVSHLAWISILFIYDWSGTMKRNAQYPSYCKFTRW